MKVKNLVYLAALLIPVSKRIGGVIFVLIVFSHLAKAQPYNVNVVPIGKVEEEHLELIKSSIQSYYNANVYIHDSIKVRPEFITKFDTILDVNAINKYLEEHANDLNQKWLGATDWHITIGNFTSMVIRGFANKVGGNCAVISSAKVLSEVGNDSKHTFSELYSRVARHEFGHLLGLEHCSGNQQCLMIYGNSFLEDADDMLCEQCRNKLNTDALRSNK